MQTRQLGNSDLHITPVGIGAWAMGGSGWAFSWSHQDDQSSIDAIHAALDAGMNWIDTAAVYGLGHSEEVVAKALSTYSGSRPYVFTKCERTWNENREIIKSLKPESIRKECEDSLRRLNVETIDLYQIHWPEPDEDIEQGWTTLVDLQREGKVRWIGVSNFNAAQMKRLQAIGPITSLQPPYSMMRPEVETEILPHALKENIGVIVYSPMGSGLLSGSMTRERLISLPADDWRNRNVHFQEPLLSRNLAIAAKLQEVGDRFGKKAGEIAIAFVLKNPAVTGAIVGFRNPAQVAELQHTLDFQLPDQDFQELVAFQRQVIG
jgi:aryl-alcohol dehydrogenase-like predicted oxidoreductase